MEKMKMNMKGNKFLNEKFKMTAETAAKNSPENKVEKKIEFYLDRLKKIVENPRGLKLLKDRYIRYNTLKLDDPVILGRVAREIYESEKRQDGDRGIDRNDMGFDFDKYKKSALSKQKEQIKSLERIFDYITNNEDHHPDWFRYFILKSIIKIGGYNREEKNFNKRIKTTTAPYLSLNHEAVGFVRQILEKKIGIDNLSLSPEEIKESKKADNLKKYRKGLLREKRNKVKTDLFEKYSVSEEQKEEWEKVLNNQNFQELYSLALREVIKGSEYVTTEGKWRKFEQYSDPKILEDTLDGQGTGWCTAVGSVPAQLQEGDFYTYYTYSKEEWEKKEDLEN